MSKRLLFSLFLPWTTAVIGSLLLLMVQRTAARLEAAVILPHGDFALDPTLLPPGTAARKAAEAIAKGAASVGMWFGDKSKQVDLILLMESVPSHECHAGQTLSKFPWNPKP